LVFFGYVEHEGSYHTNLSRDNVALQGTNVSGAFRSRHSVRTPL
jgi:hypothetical protein